MGTDLKFSDLEMTSLFSEQGNGGGDKLFRAIHRVTGELFIAKELFFDGRDSIDLENAKQFDHPNILKYREALVTDDRICLLFEHVVSVTSEPALGRSFTSEPALVSVVRQVLIGLAYLHGKGISHGDVNPSNILVDSAGRVKVLYLGKIKFKGDAGRIDDEFSWDVWCLGLFVLKLFEGSLMVPSTQMWSFILCCMQIDPRRWTMLELLDHPCFGQLHVVPSNLKREFAASISKASESTPPNETEQQISSRKKSRVSLVTHNPRVFAASISTASESTLSYETEKSKVSLVTRDQLLPPKKVNVMRTIIGDFVGSIKKPKVSLVTHDQRLDKVGTSDNSVYKNLRRVCQGSIKKSKVSLGVEEGINEVESSKDPIQIEIVPDVLVRCSQHSAMFFQDFDFEKDKCIQLWIAEECIEFEETRIMEDVANFYFDELVREEFIIPSKFDHLYRHMRYKVNTSKVPTSFSGQGEYIRVVEGGLGEISGEVLHLVWHCKRLDKTSVDALKKVNHLRTLLVLADFSGLNRLLPNDTFLGLYRLRTLDLSCTNLLELPGSIRLLEALRYLDISETSIKRLPESIDCLCCLQTLRLRGCSGLSTLPKGLRRLINLRHLAFNIVGQLEFMPTGMGNLVKLQTLQAFIVGENDGRGIRELKNMNDITGSFCISKLENVSSADEAKEAALWDKKRIDKLELRWQDYGNEKSKDTSAILECLQPHFHLRELQIIHFSGLKLPSWISNPSYIDLASITLYKCINCDVLPTIGKLPSLKNLLIVEMNNLRYIDSLLSRDDVIQESSLVHEPEHAFPKLEKLTLENMLNLEEWTGISDGDFPCLSHLSIRNCPKLSTLPYLSCLCSLQCLELKECTQLLSLPEGLLPATLESLIVKGCPRINKWCLSEGGKDYFKIMDFRNVYIDFEKISLD